MAPAREPTVRSVRTRMPPPRRRRRGAVAVVPRTTPAFRRRERSTKTGRPRSDAARDGPKRPSPKVRRHVRKLHAAHNASRCRFGSPRRLAHGRGDDAKHCTFLPRTCKGDPLGEGGAKDGERVGSNFIARQDAWNRKVRTGREHAMGKKDYDCLLNKKSCPGCGAVQTYDEVLDKRTNCVECALVYKFEKTSDIDGFLGRLGDYEAKSAEAREDLEYEVRREAKKRATKKAFRDGRTVEVPLFPQASEYAWDSFIDRLETDLADRKEKAEARKAELRTGEKECTFHPNLSHARLGGGGGSGDDEDWGEDDDDW